MALDLMPRRELIITFHGLGDPPESVPDSERKVWVPVQWLEALLDALPDDGVTVAFDDGNHSDVTCALPALRRRGRTAHFFVCAGEVGIPGRLGLAELRRLRDAGMRIGSHGLRHRNWRAISDAELSSELNGSRAALASFVGTDVAEAACPFGSYDRRVLRGLRGAGYARVYTSDGGTTARDRWLAARTTITRDHTLGHWLDLVTRGAEPRPDPLMVGKRILKRIR
jgi:peptidoglycan/xylan/chitin deacetylase (PgdA/CDA1 family)